MEILLSVPPVAITESESGQKTLSARELYEQLGFDRSQWSRWAKKNIEANPFAFEGHDWQGFDVVSNGNLTRNYQITVDFAERLCMLARTEQGESVRKWFQAIKNAALKPLSRKEILKMALEAEAEAERLAIENQQLKELRQADQPKVNFFDAVADAKDAKDLGSVAKLLGIPGIGRTKLFSILRQRRVLQETNIPFQRFIDRGWFRVVEVAWSKPDGTRCIRLKTLAYQKGIQGIHLLLKQECNDLTIL